MKHLLFLFIFIASAVNTPAVDCNYVQHFTKTISEKPNSIPPLSYENTIPPEKEKVAAPGTFSSFWFSFLLAAIGTGLLYGAFLGPLAVIIVYFSAHRKKKEVHKALWGWLTGTALGILILILRFVVL